MDPASQFFAMLYQKALAEGRPDQARALARLFGQDPARAMAAGPLPEGPAAWGPTGGASPGSPPAGSGLTDTALRPLKPSDLMAEEALIQNQPVVGAPKPLRVPLPRAGAQPIPAPAPDPAAFAEVANSPAVAARRAAFENFPGPGGPQRFGIEAGPVKPVSELLKNPVVQPQVSGITQGGFDPGPAARAGGWAADAVPGGGTQIMGQPGRVFVGGPSTPPVMEEATTIFQRPAPAASAAEAAATGSRFAKLLGRAQGGLGKVAPLLAGFMFGFNAADAGYDAHDPTLSPWENTKNVGGAVGKSVATGIKDIAVGSTPAGFLTGNPQLIPGLAEAALAIRNGQTAGGAIGGAQIALSALSNAGNLAYDWLTRRPGSQMSEFDPSAMSVDPGMGMPDAAGEAASPAPPAASAPAPRPARRGGMGGVRVKPSTALADSPPMEASTPGSSDLSLLGGQKLTLSKFPELMGGNKPSSFMSQGSKPQFAGSPSFGGVNTAALSKPVLGEGRRRPLRAPDKLGEDAAGKPSLIEGGFQPRAYSIQPEAMDSLRAGASTPGLDLDMDNDISTPEEDAAERKARYKRRVSAYMRDMTASAGDLFK